MLVYAFFKSGTIDAKSMITAIPGGGISREFFLYFGIV